MQAIKLVDTEKDKEVQVGSAIVRLRIMGKTVEAQVTNSSLKKWVRVSWSSFQGGGLFNRSRHCDLSPGERYLFKELPIAIIDMHCNEIPGV